ncbi:PREDICTED: ephrin type-A receptor 4-like isoform X2 [Acropora digitifera]|uniref:ephrin type-A receptor 4-like isoform X2 n=1 Tax=Acropora digitifera TaxID=70779 RepID=UPI00077ACAEE|nr:PREDICTED: ephrin type-A receptor 4-like isoform X2 [Acropora digitifera]
MKANAYRRHFIASTIFFAILESWRMQVGAEKGILLHKSQNMVSWNWLTSIKFGPGSGWSRDDNSGGYTVCDLSDTLVNSTNSWLISEYVDLQGAKEIHIDAEFTVRECPSQLRYCKQSFNVYTMQVNGPVVGGISEGDVQSGNFAFVDKVNATNLWIPRNAVQRNQAKVTFDVNGSKGFYLAFQDKGACVALLTVTLSYNYCPELANNGATFKKTPAPLTSNANISVIGECFNGSSVYPSQRIMSMMCLSSGQWLADNISTCLCPSGYELIMDTCSECFPDYYKDSISNGKCVPCPDNSYSSSSRNSCLCKEGFYRTTQDANNESCSAPLSGPRDINITIISNNVAIVVWTRPAFDGGRADLRYDIHCGVCANMRQCSNSCLEVTFWPSEVDLITPLVTLSNLHAEVLYNITVIAKNGVSHQLGISSAQSLYKTFFLPRETSTRRPRTSNINSPVPTAYGNLTITDAPPSGPRDINIKIISNNVAIVVWTRPAFHGDRADLRYDIQCGACANMSQCSNSCLEVRFWPSEVDLITPLVTLSNLHTEVLYNITVIAKNGVSHHAGISSAQSLYKTFFLPREKTTNGPRTSTTNSPIPTVDGNLAITVSVAIGISVAVTFVICFFVATVVIFLLTKSWKKKQLADDDNHSSASKFSQMPMKRLNSLSNKKDKTELMDKTYSSLHVAHDKNRNWSPTSSPRHELASFYEQKSLPAIKIQESSPASKSLGVTDLKPLKKTRLPALNLNSPRPISPFLPRRKQTVSPSPSSRMRNSPEGSENGRPSSVCGPSWFPAEEVQYNV